MHTTIDRAPVRAVLSGTCLALSMLASPATAQQSCENLSSLKLQNTRITLAQRVAAGAFVAPTPPPFGAPPNYSNLPAFCRVTASISPVADSEIKIEVWLPSEGWNGKFVGVGNGGFSGAISHPDMRGPLMKGYAVASTNTGHDGSPADATFAVGHLEKLIDHAWRAVHEMTVTAKAITAARYGRAPQRSYWTGCSTGGRQGLKEAQRFPTDYDGIVAGAPAHNWVPLMTHAISVQRIMTDTSIGLTPRHLARIKTAAIAACDTRDGVTDNVVEDPRRCAFDPSTLACTGAPTQDCLTARQVAAIRSVYAGVVNGRGATLFPGPAPGGEPLLGAFTPNAFPIGANYFRDLVIRDANWSPAQFDVDRDMARALAEEKAELTTTKADLREFIGRGGKLLLWHGWTDAMIPAGSTIEYYESVLAASGSTARNAVRLFMMPGVDHCSGGEGASTIDALQVMEAWVEGGQAPERIVAQRPLQNSAPRTRALCLYPQIARYRGTGSTDDQINFDCVAPPQR